jgi:hypothetical protein
MGLIEIVEGAGNQEVREALAAQTSSFQRRTEENHDAVMATIDKAADDDLIVVKCIGPGTRPGSPCDGDIPVRQSAALAEPPLCARHKELTPRCFRRGGGAWEIEAS